MGAGSSVPAELTEETQKALAALPEAAQQELLKAYTDKKDKNAAPAAPVAAPDPEPEAAEKILLSSAPPKSALELQMEQMMAGALMVGEGAKAAKKEAGRARRKSRDLMEQLNVMEDGVKDLKGAGEMMRQLGGFKKSRRDSKDFADDTLKATFDALDTDGSGMIDRDELKTAIEKETGKTPSDSLLNSIFEQAGQDEISFDQYKKIMMTELDD